MPHTDCHHDHTWTGFAQHSLKQTGRFLLEFGLYFLIFFAPAAWQANSVQDGDEARNAGANALVVSLVGAARSFLARRKDEHDTDEHG